MSRKVRRVSWEAAKNFLRTDERLNRYGEEINANLPKSEQWFQALWKQYHMLDDADQFNKPCGLFIPDVLNEKYKYILEIDGKVHSQKDVVLKDMKKRQYYESQGYFVFRIRAYDFSSFKIAAKLIKYRKEYFNKIK